MVKQLSENYPIKVTEIKYDRPYSLQKPRTLPGILNEPMLQKLFGTGPLKLKEQKDTRDKYKQI